jgi:hypothetical protein
MARADLSCTTNRAPGVRPAPTFSSVEVAHAGLVERLAGSKPERISAIVADTSHVAPGGAIDRKYLPGLISNVAGDVTGSIANAADDLSAGRVW